MANISTSVTIMNPALRNSVRIRYQDARRDEKTGKLTGVWRDVPTYAIIAPKEQLDLALGEGRRALVEWLPT